MQLKSEFRNYESLRREHDSQIIQIAMEAGKDFILCHLLKMNLI
jgi:hypothetical protein